MQELSLSVAELNGMLGQFGAVLDELRDQLDLQQARIAEEVAKSYAVFELDDDSFLRLPSDLPVPIENAVLDMKDEISEVYEAALDLSVTSSEKLDALSEQLVTLLSEQSERGQTLIEDLLEGSQTMVSLGSSVTESIADSIDRTIQGIAEAQLASLQNLDKCFQDAILGKFDAIGSDARGEIQRQLGALQDGLTSAGSVLSDEMAAASNQLYSHISERTGHIKDTVVEKLSEVLKQKIMSEVQSGIVDAQLGAQITTFMQPYIPQLMMAKAALGPVKSLLDAMKI